MASCYSDEMRKANNRLITFDPGCMAGKILLRGFDNNDNAAPASQCVKKAGGAANLSDSKRLNRIQDI